jgi:hypothetical protein
MAPAALFSALHGALIYRTKNTGFVLRFHNATITEPIAIRNVDDTIASIWKYVSN